MRPFYYTLIPAIIFFPFFAVWLIAFIREDTRKNSTVFRIKPESFESGYKFFNTSKYEFVAQKITGIVFYEGIWDRWWQAFSVRFWSIGSDSSLSFNSLAREEGLEAKMLAKIGLYEQEAQREVRARFRLADWFKAETFTFFFWLISTMITLLVGLFEEEWLMLAFAALVVFGVGYLSFQFWYYSRMSLTFYPDYLCFEQGVFNRRKTFVTFDDIKALSPKATDLIILKRLQEVS